MRAQREWGWHRLEQGWARQLVLDARIRPGALVLDIGAGDGALTRALVDAGARVIAFELHPARVALLRERFRHDVVVVHADVNGIRLPRRPYHVVANPPFDATSEVLRRLLQPGSRLVSATLVLQHQAAARWAGSSAPAARRWMQNFDATLGRRVPRSAFTPRPHVDCRVLDIRRRSE